MELSAAGWDPAVHNEAAAAKDCVFAYVCDVFTGWSWLCTLPQGDFREIGLKSQAMPAHADAIRAGIADLVTAAAAGKPRDALDGVDWEHQLSLLVAAYAGTTRTWELAGGFRQGGHFMVAHYTLGSAGGNVLRPFAAPHTGGVLPPWQLNELLKEVVQRDALRHPEWFRDSKG